jgi:hypothetical protein
VEPFAQVFPDSPGVSPTCSKDLDSSESLCPESAQHEPVADHPSKWSTNSGGEYAAVDRAAIDRAVDLARTLLSGHRGGIPAQRGNPCTEGEPYKASGPMRPFHALAGLVRPYKAL